MQLVWSDLFQSSLKPFQKRDNFVIANRRYNKWLALVQFLVYNATVVIIFGVASVMR